MVNLLEFQGKEMFRKYNIPVPNGRLLKSENEIKKLDDPSVLKVQVPTGHRGKSGGISIVKTLTEACKALENMQKMSFDGFSPKGFLLEDMVKHTSEIYISISLDRGRRSPVLIASSRGGVDIENVPKGKIVTFNLNQLIGIPNYVKRQLLKDLGLKETLSGELYSLIDRLWSLYKNEDAELVEINPLAVTENGLIALDSKISIDDDSLFRHKELSPDLGTDPLEIKAKKEGIAFVRLDGDIGLIANGAGLTMATIDQIALLGGKAGDFLDLGGTDDPAKVAKAIELVAESNPKTVLINVFGGVTKADTVANGIVLAVKAIKPRFKIFVRLNGFNAEKGKKLLTANGIKAFSEMGEAVSAVVLASKKV